MNKFIQKTIMFIGIVLLALVLILNILYTSSISYDILEIIKIEPNSIVTLVLTATIMIVISVICKKVNSIKIKKDTKILIFLCIVFIYFLAQILWIGVRQAEPVADQLDVYNAAVDIYYNNLDKLKSSQYLEMYPQQLTLATMYATIFKIFGSSVEILQCFNAIANTCTLIGIILITKQVSKQYNVNLCKTLLFTATFVTLPLLSTFIYGDFVSLPMCMFAIYFIMKYSMENKKRYAIISAIFMAMAYIARMNNLIYIIAIVIYLILNLLDLKKNSKKTLEKILLIIAFVLISILPTTILKTNMQDKLGFDKAKTFPVTGFLQIGMEESYRANGWFNEGIVSLAKKDIESAKPQYIEGIVNRIQYFIKNPIYTMDFYISKNVSMWAENTYSAIWYNQSFNFTPEAKPQIEKQDLDNKLYEIKDGVVIYQKALVLLIFGIAILVMIKYRKDLSNEVLLLVTIFIGGFLFHTLWEAKSRYIISYILVLIPIASIIVADKISKEEIYEKVRLLNSRIRTIWSNICK